MDPLSDVLSLLKPRSYMFGGFDLGKDWSFRFSNPDAIKCFVIVSGEGWLAVEGVADTVHLEAGDCFLLPRERPFRIASNLALPSLEAETLFPARLDGGIFTYNGGGECFSVGGHFDLTGDHAGALLGMLPPIVHLQNRADGAALRWSVERMMDELRNPQPGGYLIAQNLAYMLLIEALRLHLAEGQSGKVGWLFALADKRMSTAITAMHRDPGHRWTLRSLSECAGMSRTSFTLKFKETVGMSPMEYLTRWRMLRAADRLANSNDPVSTISLSVGYESESAFSATFRRVMACSPRQYGHVRTQARASRV